MKKQGQALKQFVINLVLSYPKRCFFIMLAFHLLLIPGLKILKSNYSVRIWFPTSDPLVKELDQFERTFGNDQVVVIGVENAKGIFNKETLQIIQELTESAWERTDVIRVDSLTNYNHTKAEGDDIKIGPFLDTQQEWSEDYLAKKKETALESSLFRNRFIDPLGQMALIQASLRPVLDKGESNYKVVTEEFEGLLKKYEARAKQLGVHFSLSGSAPVNEGFRRVAQKDLNFMLPISLVCIALFLWIIFRRISGVLFPLGTILLLVLTTFGLAGELGITYNNMTSAIPGIITAICLADLIHIMSIYFKDLQKRGAGNDSSRQALAFSLHKNFVPTILTTVSTAMGFCGLAMTTLLPIKELGLLATFASLCAWFDTYFLVAPCLLALSPAKKVLSFKKFKGPNHETIVKGIQRYRWPIVGFAFVTTIFSVLYGLKTEVSANPFSYFSDHVSVKRAYDNIRRFYGGTDGPQLIIRSGSPDGVKSPEFLKKVEELELWIEKQEGVNQVVSLLDIIKELHQNLNGGQKSFHKIPDKRRTIAEELFLYALSLPQGMDLNNLVGIQYDDLRLSIMWRYQDSKTSLEEVERISRKATELGLDHYVSGNMFLYHRMNTYIVDTFFKSLTFAFILISTLMIYVCGSFKIGLISLLPNIIPLCYGLGLLRAMNGTIDIGTSIVASVCLGIAVDDTIHFLSHYNELKREGLSPFQAILAIFHYTVPPLVFTTITLVIGFGLFALGEFMPNVFFGVLSALILTTALLVDLFFLPSLLFILEKE